jgi:hypothetical protein
MVVPPGRRVPRVGVAGVLIAKRRIQVPVDRVQLGMPRPWKLNVQLSSPNDCICTRRVMIGPSPRPQGLTACAARPFFPTIPSFDHGYQVSATSGWCSLAVKWSHRAHESRKGGLQPDTSQGSFWLRQHYPHNDQSGSPSSPPWSTAG